MALLGNIGIKLSPDPQPTGGSPLPAPDRVAMEKELSALMGNAKAYSSKGPRSGTSSAFRVLGLPEETMSASACDQAKERLSGLIGLAVRDNRMSLRDRNELTPVLGRAHSEAVEVVTGREQVRALVESQKAGEPIALTVERVLGTGKFDSPQKAVDEAQKWAQRVLAREHDNPTVTKIFGPTGKADLLSVDEAIAGLATSDIAVARAIPKVGPLALALKGLSLEGEGLEKFRDALKLEFKDKEPDQKIMMIAAAVSKVVEGLPSDLTACEPYAPGIGAAVKDLRHILEKCEGVLSKRQSPSPAVTPVQVGVVEDQDVASSPKPPRHPPASEKIREFFRPWLKVVEVGGLALGGALLFKFGSMSVDLFSSGLGGANMFGQVLNGAHELFGSIAGFPVINVLAGMFASAGIMSLAQAGQRYFVRQDVEEVARAIGTSSNQPEYVEERTRELFEMFCDRLKGAYPRRGGGRAEFDRLKDSIVSVVERVARDTVAGGLDLGKGRELLDKELQRIPSMYAYRLPSYLWAFSNSAGTDLGQLYMRSMADFMFDAVYTKLNWGGLSFSDKQLYPQKMESQLLKLVESRKFDEFIVRYTNPIMYGISDWLRLATVVVPTALLVKFGYDYLSKTPSVGVGSPSPSAP